MGTSSKQLITSNLENPIIDCVGSITKSGKDQDRKIAGCYQH